MRTNKAKQIQQIIALHLTFEWVRALVLNEIYSTWSNLSDLDTLN